MCWWEVISTLAKAQECRNGNGRWLLDKRRVVHRVQDRKRQRGGCTSGIVLRTREPRAKPELWRTKKRGNTRPCQWRSMKRKLQRLQATNPEPDTDLRKIKIRAKGGHEEIRERKEDRSAKKRCYVLPYSSAILISKMLWEEQSKNGQKKSATEQNCGVHRKLRCSDMNTYLLRSWAARVLS